MSSAMELSEQTLETIGKYVKRHLSDWMHADSMECELELRERIVRVEERIKSTQELMRQGFNLMEKRFEQVDKRFEQVGKRIEDLARQNNRWMTVITVLISLIGLMGWWQTFVR